MEFIAATISAERPYVQFVCNSTKTLKIRALNVKVKQPSTWQEDEAENFSYLLVIRKADGTLLTFEAPLGKWKTLESYEPKDELILHFVAGEPSPIRSIDCIQSTEILQFEGASGYPRYTRAEILLVCEKQ